MFEVFVLVPRRKPAVVHFLAYLFLGLAIVFFLMTCYSFVYMTLSFIFAVIWYFLQFRQYREFEYSFFDGEFRFARSVNKSRRKRLKIISIDEVLQIAPSGDQSVARYENDATVKKIDYTSRRKGAPCYDLAYKGENGLNLIRFEPDEPYLDAVCIKYGQKVIRRKPEPANQPE